MNIGVQMARAPRRERWSNRPYPRNRERKNGSSHSTPVRSWHPATETSVIEATKLFNCTIMTQAYQAKLSIFCIVPISQLAYRRSSLPLRRAEGITAFGSRISAISGMSAYGPVADSPALEDDRPSQAPSTINPASAHLRHQITATRNDLADKHNSRY